VWQKYFEVANAQEPQVMLLDMAGKVAWRGHGKAVAVEQQLRSAASSH
jgi:hypothetical protein